MYIQVMYLSDFCIFLFLDAEPCVSIFAIGQMWLKIRGFMALLFEYGVHGIIYFPS